MSIFQLYWFNAFIYDDDSTYLEVNKGKLDFAAMQRLRARGGFLVSLEWDQGGLSAAEIISSNGGPCSIHLESPAKVEDEDGRAVSLDDGGQVGFITFATVAGVEYKIVPEG